MQKVFYAIIIVEMQIILMVPLLSIIEKIICLIDKKINPTYPSCNIDPLCHPSFAWDKNGNGWIGNNLVIKNKS